MCPGPRSAEVPPPVGSKAVQPMWAVHMLLASLSFSAMAVLVKMAGRGLPSQEIVAFRAAISLALGLHETRRQGRSPLGAGQDCISIAGVRVRSVLLLLLVRGLFGFLALSFLFYCFTRLPLAEATLLKYLHPVMMPFVSAAMIGEAPGPALSAAAVLGLAGVAASRATALADASGGGWDQPAAVAAGAAGALLTACANSVSRRLSLMGEHSSVIVLYFPVVALPLSVPSLLGVFVLPVGWQWAMLLGIGVFTQIGQELQTRALSAAPSGAAAAVYSYVEVIFAAAWGFAIWGDVPTAGGVAGAALIVAAVLLTQRGRDFRAKGEKKD